MKKLLSIMVVLLVITTSLIGIMLILDVVTGAEAKETATKLFQIFGVATIACAIITGVVHVNRDSNTPTVR